ncbi:hypothetical protein UCDDS831_g01786 [Diplodia seriata]|uniref:Rho termination factor-like N-terminal domain-containing protein n=1 Tax=Diplodia seriata TaxID=420778 RepID=A0A0G2ET82_9PEZI|nr:hypothetical protein UCDDS831_g01786 [Diplodia seriata]
MSDPSDVSDVLRETHEEMKLAYGDHFDYTIRQFEAAMMVLRCLDTFEPHNMPKSLEMDGWILGWRVYSREMTKIRNGEVDEGQEKCSYSEWSQTEHGMQIREEKDSLRAAGNPPVVTRVTVDAICEVASPQVQVIADNWHMGVMRAERKREVAASQSVNSNATTSKTPKTPPKPKGSKSTTQTTPASPKPEGSRNAATSTKSALQLRMEKLNVAELKNVCKERNLTGYSRLKKDEIVRKIVEHDDETYVE